MSRSGLRGAIADTCIWIAAFDETEDRHEEAGDILDRLRDHVVLVPWPIMYEVLRTRTVRKPRMVEAFDRVMRRPKMVRIDDAPYREECIERTIAAVSQRRTISLMDMVVRAVLDDPAHQITRLLTFNAGDFHDVCRKRGTRIEP